MLRRKSATTDSALTARVSALESTAWVDATLINSWTNVNVTTNKAKYRKEGARVFLLGLVTNVGSVNGTTAFTLPVGYRPAENKTFGSVDSGGIPVCVVVHTDGSVTLEDSGLAQVFESAATDGTLDGISFPTDA